MKKLENLTKENLIIGKKYNVMFYGFLGLTPNFYKVGEYKGQELLNSGIGYYFSFSNGTGAYILDADFNERVSELIVL